MLEEMTATHFLEWVAVEQIEIEEQKRAEIAARAEQGVASYRRGRHR